MAKYTKHNSNYIKTNRHQFLNGGSTIFERDWVTIGNQLHFGPGKVPYYTNGNFIFTTSPTPFYQKKHKNGTIVSTWTYDDVANASSSVNQINVDEYTENIRSFAYYGSCVELVRTSVEHIINTFPANITLSHYRLEIPPTTDDGEFTYIPGYILNNPFKIDLYHKNVKIGQYDNPLRWLSYSFQNYTINGSKIEKYNISDWLGDLSCPQNDQYYIKKAPVVIVTINDAFVLKGYKLDNEILFCYEGKEIDIRPNEEFIEEYFSSLKGFEKQLLNRNSKPLYSNSFITPIEHDLGFVYYKRTYTWPSNDYCIDITSTSYIDFLSKLTDMAQLYDELWTDNIWRNMTHEAIKNYDWTYTREFEIGDEEDNINGGERMHKVLNIIGRVFDDVKQYIDKIKQHNRITYSGDRNIPNALLSDKLELSGMDIYSTIPTFEGENLSTITITDEVLNKYVDNDKRDKWYPTKNHDNLTFVDVDIDFMRKLTMSAKRILSTKGTIASIDMIMAMFGYGENDYTLTEEYYTVTPKEYNEKFDDEFTFGEKIVQLNFNKGNELLYDDDVSGIPVGSFIVQEKTSEEEITNTTYLIPYFNQDKIYDGNFYFQSKGGWCYDKDSQEGDEINSYGWQETLSYLHVVSTVGDLLNVNPNSGVQNGDIYYVVNINDLVDYSEEDYKFNSHFFVLRDVYNPEMFSSWDLLDLSGEVYENMEEGDEKELFKSYVKKANYLNNIIPDNIGNNPHVGYGRYDLGNEYLEYMKQPFKYSIDSKNLDDILIEEAEKIQFEISEPIKTEDRTDKIQIFNDKRLDNEETLFDDSGIEYPYRFYDKELTIEKSKNEYYLNSKVLYFKNNIDNDNYRQYFKEIIMKYVMQVIPSTTIIVLENF